MTVTVVHDAERRRWVAEVEGHECLVEYAPLGEARIEIHHTWVAPALRGRGVASALLRAALEEARERGWRVVPTCWYVAGWMQRHPEFADLEA